MSAVVGVVGCAPGQPAPPADRSTPEASVTRGEYPEDLVASSKAGPPPTEAGPSARTPRAGASPTVLTGVVREGVESGCLLLDGYLLVGGDPAVVRAGARVTVTGRVEADLMTTCQQ